MTGVDAEDLDARSPCCGSALRRAIATRRIVTRYCRRCRSLWATHLDRGSGERPWQDLDLDQGFISALRTRRSIQATRILRVFEGALKGRGLDYGCGQGAFVSALLTAGIDAWGADIDLTAPGQARLAGRTRQLSEPWQVPTESWDTICLLDVIEHHAEPVPFLRRLPARNLLVKVPSATGPVTVGARLLARLGRPSVLEALFLVDDPSPHMVLLTHRGFRSLLQRGGWKHLRIARLPEVGWELPDRIRIGPRQRSVVYRGSLKLIGAVLAGVSPVWCDTYVGHFAPVGQPPSGVAG